MSSRNRRPGGRRFFAPGAENSAPLHARVQGPPPAAPLGRDGIMNQTENYQLSLWDPEDRIQRTDFNADNAKIEAALADHAEALAGCGNCQIYTTTYTGTGTYGEGNPTSITFPVQPVLAFIFTNSGSFLFLTPESQWAMIHKGNAATSLFVSWSDKTVSWYSSNANDQLNAANNVYRIVAFYPQA